MKTKFLIALLALGLAVGCKKEPDYPLNSPPNPQYLLALEIVDQVGNNISQSVGQNAIVEIIYTDSGVSMYMPQFYPQKCEDGIWYSVTYGLGLDKECELKTLALTWKIKSEAIFGDDQVHIIPTNWVYDYYYPDKCESLVFEGKTYVPQKKNGYWTARVVVNR